MIDNFVANELTDTERIEFINCMKILNNKVKPRSKQEIVSAHIRVEEMLFSFLHRLKIDNPERVMIMSAHDFLDKFEYSVLFYYADKFIKEFYINGDGYEKGEGNPRYQNGGC